MIRRLGAFWSRHGTLIRIALLVWLLISIIAPVASFLIDETRVERSYNQIAGGLLTCLIAFCIAGARWSIVARAFNQPLPFAAAVRFNFIGLFYFCVTPFGVGMDFLKIVKSVEALPGLPVRLAAVTVIVDRIMGLLGVLGGFACVMFAFHRSTLLAPMLSHLQDGIGFFSLTVVMLALIATAMIATKLARKFLVLDWRIIERPRISYLVLSIAVTLISQAVLIVGLTLMLDGFGILHSTRDVAAALLGGMIFTAIPATVFGVGAPQLANIAVLIALGWREADAALLTFLAHGATICGGVLGGILAIVAGTAKPAEHTLSER